MECAISTTKCRSGRCDFFFFCSIVIPFPVPFVSLSENAKLFRRILNESRALGRIVTPGAYLRWFLAVIHQNCLNFLLSHMLNVVAKCAPMIMIVCDFRIRTFFSFFHFIRQRLVHIPFHSWRRNAVQLTLRRERARWIRARSENGI